MPKISVFAEFSCSEGRDDELEEALEGLVAASGSDSGVEVYSYHRDDDGTYRFFALMKSREAAENHGESEEMRAAMQKLMGLLDGPPRVSMAEPLAANGLDI